MDPRIKKLKSTTFRGKRLTRKQIAHLQETVETLPDVSRHRLCHTVCDYLGWRTARGKPRLHLTLRVLEELEQLGILTVPAPRRYTPRKQRPVALSERTAPQPEVADDLAALLPLTLRAVLRQDKSWTGGR